MITTNCSEIVLLADERHGTIAQKFNLDLVVSMSTLKLHCDAIKIIRYNHASDHELRNQLACKGRYNEHVKSMAVILLYSTSHTTFEFLYSRAMKLYCNVLCSLFYPLWNY